MKLNRLALRLLEVALGVIFFYSGWQKHLHPYEFAEAIQAYRLLPETLVGLTAAVLPWLEISCGLFLAVGLKARSCLLLLNLLLGVFLAAMIITLARGLKIDCGCGLFFQRQVSLGTILTDIFFLGWATWLYWWELPGREAG
jgi:uncharacterized membrane protein YphA (DoxX/SURF4 family)